MTTTEKLHPIFGTKLAVAQAVLTQLTEHPENHNQGTWVSRGNIYTTDNKSLIKLGNRIELGTCGTSGCIAGWSVVKDGHDVGFELRKYSLADPEDLYAVEIVDGKEGYMGLSDAYGHNADWEVAGQYALGILNNPELDDELVSIVTDYLFSGASDDDEARDRLQTAIEDPEKFLADAWYDFHGETREETLADRYADE